jgi:hypothetical protein
MVECAGSSEDKFLFSEDTSIYCRPPDDLPANAMEIAISSKEHSNTMRGKTGSTRGEIRATKTAQAF